MNTELTDEQIASYQRDGFVVKHEFLTPTERGELLAGVEQAVQQLGRYKLGGDPADKWLEGASYYDRVFLQRINLWKINDTVKQYLLAPELGSMLCRLEGIEGIRIWHDQTLQKQPWANPTAWHTDNTKWSYSSPPRHLHLDRPRPGDAAERLHVLPARQPQERGPGTT